MRRFFISIALTLFTLLTLIYFFINSSFFLKKVADIYLPKYNLSYSKISGNAIAGVEIDNLKFKGQNLAKRLIVKINPYQLLRGVIGVSKLHILDLDVNSSKKMLKSLQNSKDTSSKSSFRVKVSNIEVTTLPFSESKIKIQKEILKVDSLFISENGVEVDGAKNYLKSSIAEVIFGGDFRDGELHLKSLTLKGLDLDRVLKFNSKKESNSTSKTKTKTPLKSIKVDKLSISIKSFKKYQLNRLKAVGEGVEFDLESKRFAISNLIALIDSNIAKAKLKLKANNKVVDIREIVVDSLDLNKSLSLIDKSKSKKEDTKQKSTPLPTPKEIVIESLELNTLPLKRDKLRVDSIKVVAKSILLESLKPKRGAGVVRVKSNFADINILSRLKNGAILIDEKKSRVKLKEKIFKEYKLPLKAKSFSAIVLKGKIQGEKFKIFGGFVAKDILKSLPKTDIKRAIFRVTGDKNQKLLNLKLLLSSKLAKSIKINSQVDLKTFKFISKATIFQFSDKNLSKLLKVANISIKGDKKSFVGGLNSKTVRAKVVSRDLKVAKATIWSKRGITLNRYISLPKELKRAFVKFRVDSNINLKKIYPLKSRVKLISNLANFQGQAEFNKSILLNGRVSIPKTTLLKRFDSNLKVNSLNNLNLSIKSKDKTLKLRVQNRLIKVTAKKVDKTLNGEILIRKSKIALFGNIDRLLKAKLLSPSVDALLRDLSKLYKFDAPKIDGDISAVATIEKLKRVKLNLFSKYLILKSKTKEKKYIKNLKLTLSKDKDTINIEKYSLTFDKIKIFANKKSTLTTIKNRIKLKEFWVNDSLKITGEYNKRLKKGLFRAKSNSFTIKTKELELKLAPDIKITLLDKKIDINGKVVILGGRVKYKLISKSYSSDPDIVIIQHQKKKKESQSNLKIYLLVSAKEPILFKNRELNVRFSPKLSISKEYDKKLQILGSVDILEGGYYQFENKRFVLQKSAIYFTSNPSNPLLNIHLKMQRYNKIIRVYVAGSASEPSINFSSQPPMTREQILSYILFDNEDAIDSSNMVSALGGALAKSILKNIGIKVDSMVIKSDGFEVGKKISKKVTILYDQSDEPRAILRIEHSKKFETDISVGESSQSVDITFKKEF